eukprot:TRINITY_DN2096_c0_g1_i2.p1 TRINITY_DN2096_c0_g1~~TRINITY_DN2096_c0_g1_i2.p1  ORF type:complete len:138 (-),score=55.52 TRINITY_DN2096_c0_g1_i2:701-1114(-)
MLSRSLFRFYGNMRGFYNPLARLQGFRAFSTQTTDIRTVAGHKPPMLEESVQGRYAGVLFQCASHQEVLHTVLEDVRYLKDLSNNSEAFRNFLNNTAFKRSEQLAVLETIFKGQQLSETTISFLREFSKSTNKLLMR